MIKLNRTKENRWILQKNISSSNLIKAFVEAMKEQGNAIDAETIKNNLKSKNIYRGRSGFGSSNTMGVRMSQMCFYMFGYKEDDSFIPSPMTQLLLQGDISPAETMLINLFSMQYPTPYSKTPSNFRLYIGRLLVQLLLDKRINNRLYIDESIWFLPFIDFIDKNRYENLIESILEYRKLSYKEKKTLFENVENYNDVFANCLHEFNYYFYRIFTGFGVFECVNDEMHNNGQLFTFIHGENTKRNDAYMSRKTNSGYIKINDCLLDKARLLVNRYSCYDVPITQADQNITRSEWIRDLYEFEPLKYISVITKDFTNAEEIMETIKQMTYDSKFGGKDGKDFEKSLRDTFDLFREVRDAEIISGSGDTDILCHVINENELIPYKINVDAKSTGKSTQSINAKRIMLHINKNGSDSIVPPLVDFSCEFCYNSSIQ